MRQHPEQDLQIALVSFLASMTERHPELRWLYAVPNGIWTTKAQAGKAKAMGLRKAVSDLVLPVPRGPFHGLYLELKAEGKKPTPEQWDFLKAMSDQGYAAFWTDNLATAATMVTGYLALRKPLVSQTEAAERDRMIELLAGKKKTPRP